MKKYKRISCSFTASGATADLSNDDHVTDCLNKKLIAFLKAAQVQSYRITNTETVLVTNQDFATPYNLVCLHLEYEV